MKLLLLLALVGTCSATGNYWGEKFGHATFSSDPRFLRPTFLRGGAEANNTREYDFPADGDTLAPWAFIPLKAGATTPKGWLLAQLKLQAQGLSGHLSQFWNDVQNSIWVGGKGDGGLHERAPYWLNGIVPLAFLLKNAGIEELPGFSGIYQHTGREFKRNPLAPICTNGTDMYGGDVSPGGSDGILVKDAQACHDTCMAAEDCLGFVVNDCDPKAVRCWTKGTIGTIKHSACGCWGQVRQPAPPKPVNIMEQAKTYIDHVMAFVADDGWIGPPQNSGTDYWGRSNVMLALLQYAEASDKPTFDNITKVMLNYALCMKTRLPKTPLTSWAAERWMDMAYASQWLLENAPQGHEQDLWELGQILHEQGSDWELWFETFTGNAGGHNVNNAQALKSSAVWYRQAKNESLYTLSKTRVDHMDARYGLPTGMFNGDEILPDPPTRSPSRGIELCGVVEAMWSYNVMFATHGDVKFADRAERVAYNALPATWASPKGGDMWAHQYLQAVNEVNALANANPHVWKHDGGAAEMYGLEPNYGCCTANFNQGWPKFANMLIYSTTDGGAAVGVYAPAMATLPDGSTVDIDTNYPFDDQITVTLVAKKDMPLYVRIPAWATKATVNGFLALAGTMHKIDCKAGTTAVAVEFNPEIRLEEWDRVDPTGKSNNTVYSVHRGVLMYSLPLKGNYTTKAHHFGPDPATGSNDYEVLTSDKWAFALASKPEDMKFTESGYVAGAAPFNHSNWPTSISAQVRSVPGWGMVSNSAGTPPASPACGPGVKCGEPMMVELVPHGATDLRIGEMPMA